MSTISCQASSLDRYALDLKTDPEDIYTLYKSDSQYLTSFMTRLFEIKGYSTIMKILDDEKEHLLDNTEIFQRVSELIVGDALLYKEETVIKGFISFLMRILPLIKPPFQIYLVCKTVSPLVSQNGRFPSKGQAIRYFKYLSLIFKRSENFYNYLVSLNILNSLEEIAMTENEYMFIKKCVGIRKERFCKEVFCGFGSEPLDKLFIGKEFQTGEFVPNQNWQRLLDIKESGMEVPFDVGFVSFLKKTGICFVKLENGNVRVGEYEDVGHTTRLFQIAKLYEIRPVQSEPIKIKTVANFDIIPEEEENVRPEGTFIEPTPIDVSHTVSEFVDRFRVPHKRFRWYYSQSSNCFSDTFLNERNSNRKILFDQVNASYEAERQILLHRESIITKLLPIVEQKVKEHRAMEKQILLEKQKLEEEQELEERRKRMWKNRPRAETQSTPNYVPPSCTFVSSNRQLDNLESTDGSYVPPSRTFVQSNRQFDNSESTDGSYVPPHISNLNRDSSGDNSK
ncbi:hypothetical protein PAEPH01_0771 [Pancytospora epiphaga]|nr:hypothetical protein PAEPH01_0771 [Pancytospora epiphaga]